MYQDGYRAGVVGFETRVTATWGLIANGVDALPYAMKMLHSPHADEREDAGGVFGAIGQYFEGAVPAIAAALETETGTTARDSLIGALGEMRLEEAIPTLARFIVDPRADGDTAFEAALSLGKIVRRRFDRTSDPVVAAREWLAAHPQE